MTLALEIKGQLQTVEASSTVEDLLKKGIEKIEDDTRIDIEQVLQDMIKVEFNYFDQGDDEREEILHGLRLACMGLFFDGTDDCFYGLYRDEIDNLKEDYVELLKPDGLYEDISGIRDWDQ